MKKYTAIIILFVGFCLYFISVRGDAPSADSSDVFRQASQEFTNGNFEKAEADYLSLIENGVKSAAIYYNLGLSQEAQGKLGDATYHYEKASQLAPHSSAISSQLADIKEQAGVTMTTTKASILSSRITQWLPANWWSILLALALLLIASLVVTELLRFANYSKKLWSTLTVVCLFTIGMSLWVLNLQNSRNENRAIVLTANAPLQVSPFEEAESTFELPVGESIRVIPGDIHGDFHLVKTMDGKRGWLKIKQFRNITDS